MKPGNLPHPDNPEDIESGKGSSGMDALNREWHNGVVTGSTTGSTSSSSRDKAFWTKAAGNNKILFAALILCLGAGATAAFLTIGVSGAKSDKRQNFARRATELKMSLETAWGDYETFGLWIHQACRHYDAHTHVLKAPTPQPNTTINGTDSLGSYNDSLLPPLPSICSRQEFRELYEYILSVSFEGQKLLLVLTF